MLDGAVEVEFKVVGRWLGWEHVVDGVGTVSKNIFGYCHNHIVFYIIILKKLVYHIAHYISNISVSKDNFKIIFNLKNIKLL